MIVMGGNISWLGALRVAGLNLSAKLVGLRGPLCRAGNDPFSGAAALAERREVARCVREGVDLLAWEVWISNRRYVSREKWAGAVV